MVTAAAATLGGADGSLGIAPFASPAGGVVGVEYGQYVGDDDFGVAVGIAPRSLGLKFVLQHHWWREEFL
jgi:hypothetical protein